MEPNKLTQELDKYVSRLQAIPEKRRYWLIRTVGGEFFDSFKDFSYIGIGHNEIELETLRNLLRDVGYDRIKFQKEIRAIADKIYTEEKFPDGPPNAGVVTSQIDKFIYEVKVGDLVVIPSRNSDSLAIGEVMEDRLMEVNREMVLNTGCPFTKRKSVRWRKVLLKTEIDQMFYKVLHAHQAINDVSHYAEIIERSVGNFFLMKDLANMVLLVKTHDPINAKNLFGLGYQLLDLVGRFCDENGIPNEVGSINVKLNLNSEGKAHFQGPSARTIWLCSVFCVFIAGGGIKYKDFQFGTDGLIQKIIDYQNNKHDREIQDIRNSIESLKVLPPDDVEDVLKD